MNSSQNSARTPSPTSPAPATDSRHQNVQINASSPDSTAEITELPGQAAGVARLRRDRSQHVGSAAVSAVEKGFSEVRRLRGKRW
jgi:hypothetical protein